MKRLIAITQICLLLALGSCYSFKGISIPPEVQSFTIIPFENNANNVVPTLAQTFSERLKDKVLTESRLNYANANGDVEFKGAITAYRISPVAPTPNATTAFNRLEIEVMVDYACVTKPDLDWNNQFRRFADYDSGTDLASVQDQLIEEINEQLVEDIFNKAFNNW